MIDDPRLAALAAALHEAATQPGWRIENADFDARLILAALTDDFWSATLNQYDLNVVAPLEAEIARLRKIEETAQALARNADIVIRHYVGMTPDDPRLSHADIVAMDEALEQLRVALAGARP